MKKTIVLIFAILFSIVSLAQNGFRVEIKQVFPTKYIVFSNAFNTKWEMDNAISNQTAKLNRNSNYQILITTPSGKQTRNIQNIYWIQIVNGDKTNHTNKTYPHQAYDVPTIWEGYACSVDGSRIKGNTEKKEFVYRVSLSDKPNDFMTAFVDEETAEAKAQTLFKENASDDRLVEVLIIKYENGNAVEVGKKSNKEQYEVSLKLLAEKQAQEERAKRDTALFQHVKRFEKDMDSVRNHHNSMMENGMRFCCESLERVSKIPEDLPSSQQLDTLYLSQKLDSLFTAQRFDSLYHSVLVKDILSSLKNGQKKEIKTQLDYITNPKWISEPRNPRKLLEYTQEIESILYPPKDENAKKNNKKD